MHELLDHLSGKNGGIPLILSGAALLALVAIPAKLLMVLTSLGCLISGAYLYKRMGK